MNAVFHTLEIKLERLKEQIIHLKDIQQTVKTPQDLEKDFKTEAVVERLFQISLEALLDIGRMIISIENLPRPEENDEIFKILARAGIISEAYAKEAFGMGRFRNVLVHGYMIIDVNKVFENLKRLDLFEKFVSFTSKYLTQKTITPSS